MNERKSVVFIFLLCATFSAQAQVSNSSTLGMATDNIGNQIWMHKNLDVATYRNGDSIPKVTNTKKWARLITGAYCYYNNDSATYAAIYGKLYNWYAVNDPRGLAPIGWHIPVDSEWTVLETFLGGSSEAGNKLKENGYSHWESTNSGASNSSNFTGLPGGSRNFYGSFRNLGLYGYWWTAIENRTTDGWFRILYAYAGIIGRSSDYKQNGFSVRCVKD